LLPDARTVRIALLVLVVVLAVPLASDFLTRADSTDTTGTPTATEPATPVESNGTFRATGHLAYVVDAQGPGQLTVRNRTTGEEVFKTTAYNLYHDVDPSPVGEQTVVYVASNIHGEDVCPDRLETPCTRNVLERLNYSTGETERLYARFVEYNGSSNTHDADRVTGSEYLIGDIQFDRIYTVDPETDSVEWVWNVSAEFDRSTGGRPGDWTHLNDVEVLDEDLFMVNLRNQDQVVFVHRDRGMLENWTLGADDDYDTLYEQHNPDYIPAERGGPAIIVADSENNRVVEYQRHNETWERSWLWSDETLQWPRDADRLPNNNTLITDTHGTRLLEVTPNGTILWEREVPRGIYEAELLSTGPESEGGYSMAEIRNGTSETEVSAVEGIGGTVQKSLLGLFPPLVLHGFLFVLPTWVSPFAGALLLVDIVVVVLWGVTEGGRFLLVRWGDDE
jgi:hypothetical protein